MSAARAAVRASESRAEEASRQVELQQSLVSRGLVPAERARATETELRTAEALAAEARAKASAASASEDLARVDSEGLGVREKRVSVLESEIATLQAKVAIAEANSCNYCLSAHAVIGKGAGLSDTDIASARRVCSARVNRPRKGKSLRSG